MKKDIESAIVAYYSFVYNLKNQEQLAKKLNRSQTYVSRLLRDAQEQRYLYTTLNLPIEIREEIYSRVSDPLGEEIVKFFGTNLLKRAIVVPDLYENIDDIRAIVGKAAAFRIKEIIQENEGDKFLVGFSWGVTLRNLINKVNEVFGEQNYQEEIFKGKKIYAIPLFGDLIAPIKLEIFGDLTASTELKVDDFQYTATAIAADFNKAVYSKSKSIYLTSPTCLPYYLKEKNVEVIKEFLEKIPTYEYICNHIYDLDLIVTGISSLKMENYWLKETTLIDKNEELPKLREEGVVGDMSGILLSIPPNKKSTLKEKINKRMLGIDFNNLIKAKQSKSKILAIASDPIKAEVLLSAIRSNILSEIVISYTLARNLLKEAKKNS